MLFLCTGNICRSPMAEGLFRHHLAARGYDARVHSAGLLRDGDRASAHGVDVLGELNIDLSEHRSRRMGQEMLREADLILGMARRHIREAAVLVPECWPRAFTLKELVRRGNYIGRRLEDQPLDEWLAEAHQGRTHSDLLGESEDDDVFDPYGMSRPVYEETAKEIDELVRRLADLAFPRVSVEERAGEALR